MIRGYTDQIALLWTRLPERARAHALHPSLLPSRTGLSRQGSFRLAAHMLATPGGSRTPIRIGQMEHLHLPFLHARDLVPASLHPASADKEDREDDADNRRAAADDAKAMRDIGERHPAQVDVHAI